VTICSQAQHAKRKAKLYFIVILGHNITDIKKLPVLHDNTKFVGEDGAIRLEKSNVLLRV